MVNTVSGHSIARRNRLPFSPTEDCAVLSIMHSRGNFCNWRQRSVMNNNAVNSQQPIQDSHIEALYLLRVTARSSSTSTAPTASGQGKHVACSVRHIAASIPQVSRAPARRFSPRRQHRAATIISRSLQPAAGEPPGSG